MSQVNASATLDAVHKEVESTLQAAEQSLGRFLEDRENEEDLQNCIDYLNQLRGIFIIVEMQGAIALCESAIQLATDVPVGAGSDKDELLSLLSDAVFMLKRYAEYLASEKRDFPELLLDAINRVHLARKEPLRLESSFHHFDANRSIDLLSVVPLDRYAPLSDFEHHAHRFRHMFQVGLLDILKGRDSSIALRLMQRASEGATRLSIGYAMAPFWALLCRVTEVLSGQEFEFTDMRKRLLMQIERSFRVMVSEGSASADSEPDKSLMTELVFLLSVLEDDSELAANLIEQLGQSARYNETFRAQQAAKLFGPGDQALESLAKAVNEDLLAIKEKLDLLERGSNPEVEEVNFVSSTLSRLSSVLLVLNLPRLSADCADKAAVVDTWVNQESIDDEELLHVADAILGVEAAIAKYKESGVETDHVLVEKDPDNHFLKEARSMVVEESQGSLALTKRSITAYIESDGDKMHLANVTQALDCARGGMMLIARERVASIIASCEACIQSELIEAQTVPEERVLETLADALSSVEYYLEATSQRSSSNEELLKLSEDSLESIGYAVEA